MDYTIEKFKVKDGFPTVFFSQTQGDVTARFEGSFSQIIHGDLSSAIDRLTIHLCLLTELVNEFSLLDSGYLAQALQGEEIYEHPAISSFRCTGFSLSSDGVVLIGRKNLSSKKVLNLVSPFCLLNEDSDYAYSSFLHGAIDDCMAEIKLMLAEGKFGGNQQLDLFTQLEKAEVV